MSAISPISKLPIRQYTWIIFVSSPQSFSKLPMRQYTSLSL
ncbi:hypothetical protein PROSTU_02159 [Providencia stuartii ATCC 25827]|uniref:Uncharacterized protein n=1 Tax=Providencia stuartii ATCC 25827 TaxID=471874 RepID=A0AA86YII9_PROST|nr:hypothetical protein PROSTU_02159 [Providencia stuartii ATCC 25827]